MIRSKCISNIAACIAIAVVPSVSHADDTGSVGNPETQGQQVDSTLSQLQIQLNAAVTKLNLTQARVQAGQATVGDVVDLQAQVNLLKIQVSDAEKAVAWRDTVARLTRTVDIECKDATLTQTAQSLAKVSDVPIHLASTVPAEARLTLNAKAVPLATVLETVASQLRLKISPASDGGVELQVWPTIDVNGNKREFPDPTDPWASAWANKNPNTALGGYSGGLGGGNALTPGGQRWPIILSTGTFISGYTGNPNVNAVQGNSATNGYQSANTSKSGTGQSVGRGPNNQSGYVNTGRTGNGATQQVNVPLQNGVLSNVQYAPSGLLQGVTVAAIGNQLVVAEPGRGPKGEAGAWLTVYSLSGSQLVKQSTLFHPTRATLITPVDVPNTTFIPSTNNQRGNTGSQRRGGGK